MIIAMRISKLGLLAVCSLASNAGADPLADFGTKGHLIISADRLSPLFSYSKIKGTNNQGDSVTSSNTSMSLLWAGDAQDFYDIPRVGIDYVLAPNVTLGGSLFGTLPMSSSAERTQNGTTETRDSTRTSAFGIGARVGYVIPLTPTIAFWPRGGLSYARVTQTTVAPDGSTSDSTSLSQPGLNLEGLFVLQPAPHFGITVGPVIDLPLGGSEHVEATDMGRTVSVDTDASQLHIGITVGLLGWL